MTALTRRGAVALAALGTAAAVTPSVDAADGPARKTFARPEIEKGYADGPFGQIHYRKAGRGTPLLLCHQSPNSSAMFEAALPRLSAQGFMAIALDTPGFGMSDAPPAGQPTIEDYSTAIDAVMQHFAIQKTALLGHHTGSNVAAEFARRNPGRVTKLILSGPGVMSPAAFAASRDQRPQVPPVSRDGAHLLEMWKRRLAYPMAREDLDLANRHFCRTLLRWDGFFRGTTAAAAYDLRAAVAEMKVPTMMMCGVIDGAFSYFAEARKTRPDFTFVEFANASSYVVDEAPDAWVGAITTFLRA